MIMINHDTAWRIPSCERIAPLEPRKSVFGPSAVLR
jgi:hypothetical protein